MDTLNITGIPAFNDNYFWLIDDRERAIVVDPGDARPVIDELERRSLSLAAILITHHHPDHTGGIEQLLSHNQEANRAIEPVTVFGPDSKFIPQVTHKLREGDCVELLGLKLQVIEVPGHTLDHIAYFQPAIPAIDSPWLFCGDTLFAGGCGRLFEGSAPQMRNSLSKLAQLPQETKVYCAHEYTSANLSFALAVEPNSETLQQRYDEVQHLRSAGQPTVPSQIATELATNPFLRWNAPDVVQAARSRENNQNLNDDAVFASIRSWKDGF